MEMGNDLLSHGLKYRKSKITEYPQLARRRFELAFLLGYYDGDGLQNTTRIHSGSLRFLKQVKKRFGVPNKIHINNNEGEIHGRKIRGTEYYTHLGPDLFKEMMRTYKHSMPRKRWFPCDPKKNLRRHHSVSYRTFLKRREQQQEWRAITRDELEKLVQEMPLKQIATRYHIYAADGISKKCRKLHISIPKQGYWQKRYWAKKKSSENGQKEG